MGIIMYNNKIYSGGNEDILAPTPFIYSKDEQQVGIWTDGKPLYQKTYELTIPNASGTYAFSISTPNLDKVCHTEFSVNDIGERGYTPWYANATILFSEQTDSYIEFYFASTAYAGQKIMFTSQYTKTTDTAWQGGFKAYGFSPVIYSDEEREIGVWTDGKPLYEKTYYENNVVNGTVVTIQNADKVLIKDAYSVNANGNLCIPYSYDASNADYHFVLYADGQSIKTETTNVWVNTYPKVLFTVQYTKTTDIAGSGKYAELGVPAVHYDGTERVIGTYFGKPLYRKAWTGQSIFLGWQGGSAANYTTDTWQNNDVADMKLLVNLKLIGANGLCDTPMGTKSASTTITLFSKIQDTYDTIILEYTKTTD